MARQPTYTVETRQCGESWRVMWRGPGESVATTYAEELRVKRYEPGSGISIPRYPWIRVRQGKVVIWSCTPDGKTSEVTQ